LDDVKVFKRVFELFSPLQKRNFEKYVMTQGKSWPNTLGPGSIAEAAGMEKYSPPVYDLPKPTLIALHG